MVSFIKTPLNTDADRRRTVRGIPIGSVMTWHGATAPPGWVLCNGQELPISDYTAFYNLITANGTTFPFGANTDGSAAAGSTHFRLPDIRDRYIMSPTMSTNNPGSDYVATVGGTNTHSHNATPSVNANVASTAHQHNFLMGTLGNTGAHGHGGGPIGSNTSSPKSSLNRAQSGSTAISVESHSHNVNFGSNTDGSHNHAVGGPTTVASASHAHNISLTATSSSSNTASHLPSALRANYIVYTGTVV